MKYDFQNLNIEPQPNPKPLKVQRVAVTFSTEEGKTYHAGDGFVINANVHPDALIWGW
jgi:hypothetical protein